MKRIAVALLLLAGFALPTVTKAQDVVKGNLAVLKGTTEIGVVFRYDKLIVGEDGKEANYIKRKKAEKEAKEPGSGDVWEKAWYDDRTQHFEPRFKELFTRESHIALTADTTTRYVMVVHTKFIELGYNVGIKSKKAEVDLEIEIFDRANMKKSVCKILMDDVSGGRGMFDSGMRIGEAYGKAGKELGRMIIKKLE